MEEEEETIVAVDAIALAILVVVVHALSLVQKINRFVFFLQQQKG